MAKIAVSALMFDYILTGPISSVSAGQYVLGLLLEVYLYVAVHPSDEAGRQAIREVMRPWLAWGSAAVACAITLYFFRQNIIGIHESSDKAMKIMVVTTIMAVILIGWCLVTLAVQKGPSHSADGTVNSVPVEPKLDPARQPGHRRDGRPAGVLEAYFIRPGRPLRFRATAGSA